MIDRRPEMPDRLDDDCDTVPATRPMKMPPRTCLTSRMQVTSRVKTNTSVGTVLMEPVPPVPRPTGGDGSPVEPMKPASTSPMKRMNAPMPAVIASFSCMGTASKINVRRPVAASTTMMTPLMTTRPIASGQVTEPTTVVARNELMPSPAANANGSRAISPKRMVIAPRPAMSPRRPARSPAGCRLRRPPRTG